MQRPPFARRATRGLALAALLLAGCSAGSTTYTLFPEGHRLIDQVKAVRQTSLEPLPVPRELDKRVAPPYTVEPGDVLLVQPADLDSPVRIPGDQPVLPDGSVQLGKYGRLVVAGKTVEEIESGVRALVQAQTKDAGPITVRVVTRVSKVYYVLGDVNAPGTFVLTGRETVLDGILTAGGLNGKASRKNIILVRPTPPGSCRVVLPVCYNEIVQVGDTTTNYQLANGDRIYVPSRTCQEDSWFHRKKSCAPCGGPQYPCPLGADHHEPAGHGPVLPGNGLPTTAPATLDLPRKSAG
ncbi:MAG TPA: polysaccharide biosynthesis/export family protein [Gemmataceae bacterium]|nr:polysaccharide biosynthesis/export family protein [Gemmataceae bacterium]